MIWPMMKLGDLVTIKGGGTPSKKVEEYWNGDIPWASVKDLKSRELNVTEDTITLLGVQKSATNVVPSGTIIIPTRMALGKVAITTCEMAINQDLKAIFINDEEILDQGFFAHFLESKAKFIEGEGKGATVKGVTLDFIKNIEIPLPPLGEQKRIAAILDKAVAIRQKRKLATALTDDFLRSVFLDMFGDPVTNPKGWKIHKWKSVLRIVNGKNQKKVEMIDGKYPICGSGGVMSWANDWLVEENSIIIGRKGSINSPILMKQKFWNVDTAFGLEPQKELLSHNYLFWFCKFFNFEALNKTVTIPSLTKLDLSEIEIAVPPLEVQKYFDQIVRSIDCLREKFPTHDTINLFDSLSQKAFSGQL